MTWTDLDHSLLCFAKKKNCMVVSNDNYDAYVNKKLVTRKFLSQRLVFTFFTFPSPGAAVQALFVARNRRRLKAAVERGASEALWPYHAGSGKNSCKREPQRAFIKTACSKLPST